MSNVRFQFELSNITKFGGDIKKNIPNDIVFVFDRNAPPRGDGHFEDVNGSVVIENKYYPVIFDERLIQHMKVISVEGERMLTYRIKNADAIIFKPRVIADKTVRILGPKEFGGIAITTYPDGSQTTNAKGSEPLNFEKLNGIN
ncbi:hypothetical protein ACLEXA_07615 [Pseudescherichia vulneris]